MNFDLYHRAMSYTIAVIIDTEGRGIHVAPKPRFDYNICTVPCVPMFGPLFFITQRYDLKRVMLPLNRKTISKKKAHKKK